MTRRDAVRRAIRFRYRYRRDCIAPDVSHSALSWAVPESRPFDRVIGHDRLTSEIRHIVRRIASHELVPVKSDMAAFHALITPHIHRLIGHM